MSDGENEAKIADMARCLQGGARKLETKMSVDYVRQNLEFLALNLIPRGSLHWASLSSWIAVELRENDHRKRRLSL
jgi:hypothetical protein